MSLKCSFTLKLLLCFPFVLSLSIKGSLPHAFSTCKYCMLLYFSKILLWLAQTNGITFKTQTHAVNAHLKRVWQLVCQSVFALLIASCLSMKQLSAMSYLQRMSIIDIDDHFSVSNSSRSWHVISTQIPSLSLPTHFTYKIFNVQKNALPAKTDILSFTFCVTRKNTQSLRRGISPRRLPDSISATPISSTAMPRDWS